MADKDHNYGVAAGELRQFVERVEHIRADIADLKADEKEIFAEAKARGYDTKILRKVIALRKQDAEKRSEENAILDMYGSALGMNVFG